jgi:hypothetical protein
MKKGIAMRLKESIPPKILVTTRERGEPRAKMIRIDEMQMAENIGNPKKMDTIMIRKTRAT